MLKLVLLTYPGNFNYDKGVIHQPANCFTDIQDKFIDLPVQIGHEDDQPAVGIVKSVITSAGGFIYGVLDLVDEQPFTGVSLGYYVHTEVINDVTTVIDKIVPYHLALTDNPRKSSCLFGNLPDLAAFNEFLSLTTDTLTTDILATNKKQDNAIMDTTFLDMLDEIASALEFLQNYSGLTLSDFKSYATNGTTFGDVLIGELTTVLTDNNIALSDDPYTNMQALSQVPGYMVDSNGYVPGLAQRNAKAKAIALAAETEALALAAPITEVVGDEISATKSVPFARRSTITHKAPNSRLILK